MMSAKCGFNFTHPQTKEQPVECGINRDLLRNIIELTTKPGDLVLDCFAGSGSTAVAALTTFRNVLVMDRKEKMIQLVKGNETWLDLEHNF